MKRSLNLDKLKNRERIEMKTEEALKDIVPIEWSKEVLEGSKKVTVSGKVR